MTTLEITALQKYKDEVRRRIGSLKSSPIIMSDALPFDLFNWFEAALEASFDYITLRGGEHDRIREIVQDACGKAEVDEKPLRDVQKKRFHQLPCP